MEPASKFSIGIIRLESRAEFIAERLQLRYPEENWFSDIGYDWQKNRVRINYEVLYIPSADPKMRNFAERCKNAISMTKGFLGAPDSSKMSNASGLFWLPGAQHTNPPDNWQIKLNHVFEIYVSQVNLSKSRDPEEVCSSDLVGGAIRYEGG